MLALRRNFDLSKADAAEAMQVYEAILNDLHDSIRDRMGLGADALEGWPAGEWTTDTQSATCNQWKQDAESPLALFEFTWRERPPRGTWLLDMAIAKDEARVVVEEVWRVEKTGRAIPYEDLPPLTNILTKFQVQNVDGMEAAKVFVLGADSVEKFKNLIESSSRQLPIVVLSPRANGQEQPIARKMMKQLTGFAHVFRILPEAQDRYHALMSSHDCFQGAIRLYMPGYQPADNQWLHPYWRQSVAQLEVSREIIDRAARESLVADANFVIKYVRDQQGESLRRETERLRRQALEETQARLKMEQSIEGYERYLDELTMANDALRMDNQTLAEETSRLRDELHRKQNEIRQLNYRVTGMWGATEGEVEEAVEATPRLLLSSQAQETYRSLGDDERSYWDKHLFPKLLELGQREHQTEPIKNKGNSKPCFVYPRKRTGDGRRIIYYREVNDVHVCEIFTSAKHDRGYKPLRDHGVDRDAYDGFVDLKELVADVVR